MHISEKLVLFELGKKSNLICARMDLAVTIINMENNFTFDSSISWVNHWWKKYLNSTFVNFLHFFNFFFEILELNGLRELFFSDQIKQRCNQDKIKLQIATIHTKDQKHKLLIDAIYLPSKKSKLATNKFVFRVYKPRWSLKNLKRSFIWHNSDVPICRKVACD